MTLSFGGVQTGTALTDPSTLWTLDELQVYQQLFRVTLPHKNQTAQTYWEGRGEWSGKKKKKKKGGSKCVCVVVPGPMCYVQWWCRKSRDLPRKSFDVFSHCPPVPFRAAFFFFFSLTFSSLDLWTWPNGKLSHKGTHTHTKFQGVLFNDWKVGLQLLTSHFHPYRTVEDQVVRFQAGLHYSCPLVCQVATPIWALGRTHRLTGCLTGFLAPQLAKLHSPASLDFFFLCVFFLSLSFCHIVCLCLPVAPANANVGWGMRRLSPCGKAVPLLLHIARL